MKKARKVIVLVLCAILLMAISVVGTLAYLTSQATVQNTFTAGNVTITMVESTVDEYGNKTSGTTTSNSYKLIPGHTYTKDPTITVGANSEACWVFVKIDNGLEDAAHITMEANWVSLGDGYWAYPNKLTASQTATPFKTFTFDQQADPSAYTSKNITVTAYAIQANGFANHTAAWAALKAQLSLS